VRGPVSHVAKALWGGALVRPIVRRSPGSTRRCAKVESWKPSTHSGAKSSERVDRRGRRSILLPRAGDLNKVSTPRAGEANYQAILLRPTVEKEACSLAPRNRNRAELIPVPPLGVRAFSDVLG